MPNSFALPEKITERKVIVYKSHIDQKAVRVIAEKMKTQLFRKFVLLKPKPDEVQIVSIEKYFEPYVVVDGEYTIEYSKNWIRNIQVDDTMQELTIFSGKTKPTSLKDHLKTPCKIVKLTGEGRYKFDAKAHLIFDNKWCEVGLEQLPFVPFEEQPETILNGFDQKFEKNMISSRKEVELLKSRIVRRPTEILNVYTELFKVSERALIYKPMYKVKAQNIKTKKSSIILIDAITGKTALVSKKTATAKKKKIEKETIPNSSRKTITGKVSNPHTNTESKIESKLAQ